MKAQNLFGNESALTIVQTDLSTGEGLAEAFTGTDVVVEVISNSERPNGIQTIITKAEEAAVPVFVACGGAGTLFIDPDRT